VNSENRKQILRVPALVFTLLLWTIPLLGQRAYPVDVNSDGNMPGKYQDPEAYQVYAAVLSLDQAARDSDILAIRREADSSSNVCPEAENKLDVDIQQAISNYEQMNSKVWLLERMFPIEKPYELLASSEIVAAPSNGIEKWETAVQQYLDSAGWIGLSVVGFNSDKTAAVLYFEHQCRHLCSSGAFHFLRRVGDTWTPIETGLENCALVY